MILAIHSEEVLCYFYYKYTMAEEGERPDLTGSHNWNKESAGETARRQRAEQAQEKAELMQQYRRTDIVNVSNVVGAVLLLLREHPSLGSALAPIPRCS